MDEMFGRNLFLSDKIVESRFYDCEDKCFGINGDRLVLGLFYILNMQRMFSAETPYFRFVKIVIFIKE